jgi:hypothetical protein
MIRRIAMISEHASPLATIGGTDCGGQNIYVSELALELAARGHLVDVFTRRDLADAAPIVQWGPGVRIIHVDAGPPTSIPTRCSTSSTGPARATIWRTRTSGHRPSRRYS